MCNHIILKTSWTTTWTRNGPSLQVLKQLLLLFCPASVLKKLILKIHSKNPLMNNSTEVKVCTLTIVRLVLKKVPQDFI